ncbi:hypothetical protein [Flavobacterium sp. HSC-61S13]|uniref:hypothetical protein n=1 Tax=Flavobacterium sp. HSC-61S13 TaxID=2910963 RepID=UPI00209CD94D|nr:hypothetical protein [Flavobacterium sp. HSC-61S13]MCP1996678.1 hypothetical protein [Flavobacterium sp. HSC-61S13]
MISKGLFISIIESIRLQVQKDKHTASILSEVFKSEVNPIDNSLLIRSLIEVLRFHFPQGDDDCEFDHYCFFQNFGRFVNGDEVIVETASQFFDRLVAEIRS